jgi:hypothetical protein
MCGTIDPGSCIRWVLGFGIKTRYDMLPIIFENQARVERYNISKALFVCKLEKGSLVSPHVVKMMGYLKTLDKLACELKDVLTTDMIH